LQGISSRDLKLENLLLDRDGSDGTHPLLKICDFGYSKVPTIYLTLIDSSTGESLPIFDGCLGDAKVQFENPGCTQSKCSI
jgi:serine/threonine protein kinase